jgi:aryl-alcohol dehydrogenase-like predicted oxidoreductase
MSWKKVIPNGRAAITRDSSPAYLKKAIESSLRRLRIERLPVYFIHWPDPNTDIKLTFEFLSLMKEKGKIEKIGCSNFSAAQVREACEVSEVSYVQLPVNVLGDNIDSDMSELVKKKAIGVIAYNVLANGLLTGKFKANSRFESNDRRARQPLFRGEDYQRALRQVIEISALAKADNLTSAQFAIDWVLRQDNVVSAILGIKNCAQIEENSLIMTKI